MTLQVLTPVFPPHIKPVRDGWYLTSQPHAGIASEMWSLRYWNGVDWLSAWGEKYRFQDMWSWYGLAFDPAGAIPYARVQLVYKEPARLIPGAFVRGATCE